ncbi:MAG: hypothetical protein GY822_01165 [Deltaproteobacteria bacterium]|nr:hypothetical protein [Deltaproteobacteria bacterium]
MNLFARPLISISHSLGLLLLGGCNEAPTGTRAVEAELPAGASELIALDSAGNTTRADAASGPTRLELDTTELPVVLFVVDGDCKRPIFF